MNHSSKANFNINKESTCYIDSFCFKSGENFKNNSHTFTCNPTKSQTMWEISLNSAFIIQSTAFKYFAILILIFHYF